MKNILVILWLFIATPLWAASYYVDHTAGNDAAAGSEVAPWAHCPGLDGWTGSTTLNSGDIIYFDSADTWTGELPVLITQAGVTYDGSTYGGGTKATLQCSTGGIDYNKYAVIHSFVSDVTLKGLDIDANELDCGGIYIGYGIEANISNITVDNCMIHDCGSVASSWLYGIHVGCASHSTTGYTVSNVLIKDSSIYNTHHEAVAIYPGWQDEAATTWNKNDSITVRNCSIYNAGYHDTSASDTVGQGIIVVNDSDNVTLEFNKIYNCSSTGIWIRTSPTSDGYINSGPENTIVRYNEIYNNWTFGIFFYNQQEKTITTDIYSNLIFNNGRTWQYDYGYDFCIGGAYSYASSVINFYNNTVFNTLNECTTRLGVSINASISGTPTFNFKNNVINVTTWTAIDDPGNKLTHSNNLIYRSSADTDAHVVSGATTYDRDGTASDLTNWEATAQNTDPSFTGGTLPTGFSGTYGTDMIPNQTYFATTTGPTIDTGATLGSPYNGCINGAGLSTPTIRPGGAAYDIGAYEYESQIPESYSPGSGKQTGGTSSGGTRR